MHFEGRDLKPYAEPVEEAGLRQGRIYFSLIFVDEEMLVPVLVPYVFIGRDLGPGDEGYFYFQDVESYELGIRYGDSSFQEKATITAGRELTHYFEFEKALEQLLGCSVRRRQGSDRR